MARQPIRVGLIGVGNWARHGHLRVLSLLPDFDVRAVHSRRREPAEEAANTFGIPHVLGSVEALAAHPEVDMVVVLTTAPQHADGVKAAIATGKDVYSEWPLTTNTRASEELVRLASEAGVRTVTGLQRRLAPHNRYLRDLIAEGYVGRMRSIRMHVSMNYFQARLPESLRWTVPPENFSSMVAIYAGHFLDMLFEATSWPISLSALAVNQFPEVTIVETGEVLRATNADEFVMAARLAGDAVAIVHLEGGKRNGSGVQIDVSGDAGDIRVTNASAFGGVGDDYVMTGAQGNGLDLRPLPIPPRYDTLPASELPSAVLELAHLYAAYARDLATGGRTVPEFGDAVRMHRLLDTAFESSATGRQLDFA